MSRMQRYRSRVGLVITAVLLPLLAFAAPAGAEDPAPVATTTRVFSTVYGDDASGGHTVRVNARVTSASGVPTGSVLFYEWVPGGPPITTPAGPPVPLDATGLASVVLPSSGIFGTRYRAEFSGTGGFANSADEPGDPVATMTPEPTILKLGGPTLLKLNLTMSATFRFPDGSPAEGYPVLFTLISPARGMSGHPEMSPGYIPPIEVCTAFSDVNGLASCGGKAAGSAIVSILTLGAWANQPGFPNYDSTWEPIVTVAK